MDANEKEFTTDSRKPLIDLASNSELGFNPFGPAERDWTLDVEIRNTLNISLFYSKPC